MPQPTFKPEEKVWRGLVYRYDFPDGSCYIGQTYLTLAARHSNHKNNPCNRYLMHQIKKYPDVRPTEISAHRDMGELRQAELAEIRRLTTEDKPLNSLNLPDGVLRYLPPNLSPLTPLEEDKLIYGGGHARRRTKRFERSPHGQRCAWCRRDLPSSEYVTCRARTSGLDRRCRDCMRWMKHRMDTARRLSLKDHYPSLEISSAYHQAVQECKAHFHLTAAQSSRQRLRKLDGYVETITSVGQKIKPHKSQQRYVGLWLWIAAKAREADGVWRGSVDDMPFRLLAGSRNIKYPKTAQVTSLRTMEERGWIAIKSNTPNPRNRKYTNWSDVAITPIRPPHELALR